MKIAFIGNQGGSSVLDFYAAMAGGLRDGRFDVECIFLPWLNSERTGLVAQGWFDSDILTFEDWVQGKRWGANEVERLREEYADVNWSAVIASERAFTDYSLLLGSAGQRHESSDYITNLLVSIVTFLENVFKTQGVRAVVCQTADTLFSHVVFKVAKHLGIKIFAITPAWLLERGAEGGYFTSNEFMESEGMIEEYRLMMGSSLSEADVLRVNSLVESIKSFQNKTPFIEKNREKNAGFTALSPNAKLQNLWGYLKLNARRNPNVEYTKISPIRKVKANLLRLWRKFLVRNMFGPRHCDEIPDKSIFYPFQYQPEQSTLSQGIFYANQIGLIENISKSLPLGYTLIVKEHPWGRGARPVWQYRHLTELYNVQFCDAPSKEIIARVDAVIVISGTVGFEALLFEKPTIVLGRSFFTHCNLFFRANSAQELAAVLRKILVDRDFERCELRHLHLQRFLLSYLNSLIPYFPTVENGHHYGVALANQLGITSANNSL
jgi:hypothetical protein